MPFKNLDPINLGKDEDWEGNNAAFRCPECEKVFLVSEIIHQGVRKCPNCNNSTGKCLGGENLGAVQVLNGNIF